MTHENGSLFSHPLPQSCLGIALLSIEHRAHRVNVQLNDFLTQSRVTEYRIGHMYSENHQERLTMKISGFTFIRNGNVLGYPFLESIRSLLPLCDEIIVNVPHSTDGTLESVRAIGDSKIRIVESDWDNDLRHSGRILSQHTNIALQQCTGDWCVYIQGDEVLHEATIPAMRATMERDLHNYAVQGLLVDYTHFYGSFWTEVYSFGWYYKEVRVVRRSPNICSVGDAQGFRTTENKKLRVKNSGGRYFHYGYALEPSQMRIKLNNLGTLYDDGKILPVVEQSEGVRSPVGQQPDRFYENDQKVKLFKATHPAVMKQIVEQADWTYTSRNPLIRFRRNYFWEDIALIIKRCTGITLGVHRNYRSLD
jgi:glycosyltransferase involved in cell wall biosynthesis